MIRVGVAGWPVKHTRSPAIFAHWFERYGVDARYELIPVAPEDADSFFAELPAEWAGVNVTVPHKRTAAAHIKLEGAGARLGVANTLWRADGVVCGTSSDGPGFVASLDAAAPAWRDSNAPALILGAGGAALAIADALRATGCAVTVANRTLAKAESIAASTGAAAIPLTDLADAMAGCGVFINATTRGMAGIDPLDIDLSPLPASAVVADIVYNPLETALLAAARSRGLVAVDGLGMLLHQATLGFERWFGIKPEVDAALRAKVVATL
ncbi:shikimate dehydrogenase [Acuticoccus sp. MNP-M23]|uniref:shikimate dehydrogenase family protein n=1 Tax=Acuticoccus sp. MNP-M23 TaxID=3072793 RepID=UPI0028157D56|nr:shikimate dehydrogenase [Acuticoccus sp. MNP-M23]WMS44279.1 shikimate dehydrogenase [Acuticoccus sp. MNP-M23]